MDSPPVIIGSRTRRLTWWVAGGLAASFLIGLVLFQFNPTQYPFYPRCLLYTSTGIYCPGCGVLRALHQLAHGHLLMALRYNSLFVLSLPLFARLAMKYVPLWIAGEPSPPLKPLWIKIGVAVMIAFSLLRNIPIAPFTWLAPP